MALTKRDALEYLARQTEPVTAKTLSIDLDTRASTATELLERMAAQGLVSRDPKQRPREYVLIEAGRERLLGLEKNKAEASGSNPGGNPGQVSLTAPADIPQRLADLEADMRVVVRSIAKGFQADAEVGNEGGAEREKDDPRPMSEQIDDLLAAVDAEPKARPAQEEASQRGLVAELFEARQALGEMGWFDDKAAVRKRIGQLREQLPPGVPQAVDRLMELEAEAGFWGSGAEVESEAAWLRERLGLPQAEDAEQEGDEGEEAEEESENSEE